jgi:hypothetical protein
MGSTEAGQLQAGSHDVLRRQQRQKTEEADANPSQEPKRCSEETGAHPRRLSELGGFGKSGPGSLVRGSWWRLPSVFPSGSRSAVLGSRSSGVGGLAGGGGAGAICSPPALPGSLAKRRRSGRTGRSRKSTMPYPCPSRCTPATAILRGFSAVAIAAAKRARHDR